MSVAKKVSPFQSLCMATILNKSLNGSMCLSNLAHLVGSNNVACYSALMSLKRKGLADYFRSGSGDMWSVQLWFIGDSKE